MSSKITKSISLHPLKFSEAVTDILKVKPEPKPPKSEAEAKPKVTLKRKAKRLHKS